MKTLKITTTSENKNPQLEIHFNLWNSEKNKLLCLDIGIMANIEDKAYTVDLHIPGKYNVQKKTNDLVKDLGRILIEKEKIASNIFNCKLHFDSGESDGLYKRVEKENETRESFILRQFDVTRENAVSVSENSLILSFPIKKEEEYNDVGKIYYRVRIDKFCLDYFSKISTLKSKIFNSQYDVTRIIDFRINDTKLMELNEAHEFTKKRISFEKVHFFYICDIDVNLLTSDRIVHSRLFEKSNWIDYVNIAKSEMMAYHLSMKKSDEKKEIFSSSFLMKLQKSRTSFWHIIVYAFGVIVLAVIANIVSGLPFFSKIGKYR